tara:strand:- start:71 stop:232 length:162 start_codon:yes stop_codon:yes gene_type:complete
LKSSKKVGFVDDEANASENLTLNRVELDKQMNEKMKIVETRLMSHVKNVEENI